jgi:hypothetical protein
VLEVLAGDAEDPEVLHRQVDPAALEVLADVADEVGQLEGDAEVAAYGSATSRGTSGSRTGTISRPITAAEPYT